jgi:hypothetical protein
VPLTLTIHGAGSVKVTGRPIVSCKTTCRVTLQVPANAKLTAVPMPARLWKLAGFTKVCKAGQQKCSFRAAQGATLGVTFLAPGVRTNPVPSKTAWRLPGDWLLKIDSTTAGAGIVDSTGKPLTPPTGDEYLTMSIEATYKGSASFPLGLRLLGESFGVEGCANAPRKYITGAGCGPGSGAQLPAPDIQARFTDSPDVSAGERVAGNICFQIAAADASSLLLYSRAYGSSGTPQTVWFALK